MASQSQSRDFGQLSRNHSFQQGLMQQAGECANAIRMSRKKLTATMTFEKTTNFEVGSMCLFWLMKFVKYWNLALLVTRVQSKAGCRLRKKF